MGGQVESVAKVADDSRQTAFQVVLQTEVMRRDWKTKV